MSRQGPVIERHEAKYVIPARLVPALRRFIAPFCEPDPHGRGEPPEYGVLTLQLDAPDLTLHRAKREERANRFKLRVRTYDAPGSPVFLEIKRKIGQVIVKSRAVIPADRWGHDLMRSTRVDLSFRSDTEYVAFLEFVRLVRELDARPVARLHYLRESYFGVNESYARVSFDRRLEYQPTTTWALREPGARWLGMDTSLMQNKMLPFSGVVLELKTVGDAPRWMVDMAREFDLERDGHCKYSNAVLGEAMFRGTPEAPAFVAVLQDY
jgi:hypothetical protein